MTHASGAPPPDHGDPVEAAKPTAPNEAVTSAAPQGAPGPGKPPPGSAAKAPAFAPGQAGQEGKPREESRDSQPGCGQWLILLVMAFWLAIVPPIVALIVASLSGNWPDYLVQLGLVPAAAPSPPDSWSGLIAIALTLVVQLLAFLPLYIATRRKPEREFLHTATTLLVAISLYQALSALSRLPWPPNGPGLLLTNVDVGQAAMVSRTLTAILNLALLLPFFLLGLGGIEMRRHDRSLPAAWRRIGLRLWLDPAAPWIALGAAAVAVWPWVLAGSLGSAGTTAANLLQALPDSLNDEILFRGFALAWLWRAGRSRSSAALGSLVLYVAAQGGAVLPSGDLLPLLRFGSALMLGLLTLELTIRAGGSILPAFILHLLYAWFPLALVDPRSREEVLHWLVRAWGPLALGGMGLLLWLERVVFRPYLEGVRRRRAPAGHRRSPRQTTGTQKRQERQEDTGIRTGTRTGQVGAGTGRAVAIGSATLTWAAVLVLFVVWGIPGFHPDGFLIVMEEQAGLGHVESVAGPVERRSEAYRALVEVAERSQAPVRAELDRLGVAYRPHYLINMIEVQERPGLRRRFAEEPGVASVLFQPGVRPYPHPSMVPALDPGGPQGVEWNVSEVGAERVWELGYTGQGVVVGNADTGVAWDHPALREAYLGWDGASADHDYHWYDPWDGFAEPWDDNGHGTHTTGTVVGLDGENKIGVAPGARWIGCRNMRQGLGNPGSYVSCMEFLLAPFPVGGDPFDDGEPARGAQVVNNSWGCPGEEGCLPWTLRLAVDNLRAAGQLTVASAGNDGPACSTVQDPPAIYDSALSVGAISPGDQAAIFSSRGPVTVDGSLRTKPDLVAPGEGVRSSVLGGYASLPGTSMAGPHVVGAVALLWSAEPSLVGDLDRTEVLLYDTAQQLLPDAVCPAGAALLGTVCACGGGPPGNLPDQVYGWGQVDAAAAVERLLAER